MQSSKIVRLKSVLSFTGLSRSTTYAMMKNGTFPKSISIGARAICWLESDIQAWLDARIAKHNAKTGV